MLTPAQVTALLADCRGDVTDWSKAELLTVLRWALPLYAQQDAKRLAAQHEAQAAAYRDALQRIAYTSSNPGSQGNELTHAERWLEKAAWAREALESTTAGQSLLDRQKELEEQNKALREMCRRAGAILGFHDARCPLNPMNNYSGSESHLAEYRQVQKDIAALLGQKGVEPR